MPVGKDDRDAGFTAFVNASMPELARIAWFLTGDVHQANELVQAGLVKTYLAWTKVRPGEAIAYTRRVMVNHRTDQWRRTRREILVDEHSTASALRQTEATAVDDVDELIGPLRTLPDRQRRVVVLRYYCDLSERQVADELGISVGAVKSAASRGLAKLREHLAHERSEEWTR